MSTTYWPAPAKLNLFLYITGQRADGYHELQTLFHFLDYGDRLAITPNDSGEITLTSPLDGVPNEQNLIYRAAVALQQRTGCTQGAAISIEKNLPMGGGLGGGSSNAATTLVALNHLWQTQLSADVLADIGLTLGADVPVFVHGKSAFAEGLGEQLQPITLAQKWYLVVKPEVSISTAAIFQHPDLPRNRAKRSLNELLTSKYENDCEKLVRKCFPKVDQAISCLLEYAPSRLTGTGACIFAEFESESAACSTLLTLPDWLTGFVARGANVSPLLHQLQRQTS